ncbi:hypothetical protein BN1723_005798 [Verticillium longisporum]|uniref:Uncharacterized protein n=1 Tax=Verticillium longisporum TaxID=100787 RepID=A0A0G4NAQ1_VERLO|nr:hypothetical protein BN1723_005798 [Verticillium longisporum]
MFGSSASRWRAEFLEGSYATSPQSIVSGVPAVGALPMARLKQPAAVIMPGTGAATLELPYRQGEPKPEVVHRLAEARKDADKGKEKARLRKLARNGFEGENMGEILL